MKIYTKTGDQGETGLLGGMRVAKHHPCIEVCGSLDELNSWIGVVRSQCADSVIDQGLEQVQIDLFNTGAAVACCLAKTQKKTGVGIKPERAEKLEQWMDLLTDQLPEQKAFILPGGTECASWMHLARNVCRRTERHLVELIEVENPISDLSKELIYLNRLSDLLFLLARKLNVVTSHPETEWVPR